MSRVPPFEPGMSLGHWTVVREAERSLSKPNVRRYVVRAACDGHELVTYGYNLVTNQHRPTCNHCRGPRPKWSPEERAARKSAVESQRAERKATWVRCLTCHGVVRNTPQKRDEHAEEMHDGALVRFGQPMEDEDDEQEDAA